MDKDIENVTQFTPKPYDKFRNDTGLEEVLRDLVEQQRIANIIAWTTANDTEPAKSVVREVSQALGL